MWDMREKTDRNLPSRVNSGRGSAPAGIPLGGRLRGLLALGLCLCLALGLPGAPALAAEAPATKWEDNANDSWYNSTDTEFTLTTAEQLAGLAALVNGGNSFENKTIRLGADIDLAAHLWAPIGNDYNKTFDGTFDGGGKTVSGMTVSGNAQVAGFFAYIGAKGSVRSLNLRSASVSVQSDNVVYAGILAGELASGGTVYDCAVSGSVSATAGENSTLSHAYVAGLAATGSGTVENSSARLTSLTATTKNQYAICAAAGIAGGYSTAKNCFADVDSATLTAAGGDGNKEQCRLAHYVYDSYWDDTTALTDSGTRSAPTYTNCYAVTAEQIAGTGGTVIGSGSTYANTPSLVEALNNWAAANTGHSDWRWRGGSPMLAIFGAAYIDIGQVDEQSKQSVTGDVNADVELQGQVWENAELLSVTLPATIPFILDVDGTGALKRVLSATATLTNRSDMGVKVTLTEVADTDSLLGKVSLSLIPDPLPAGGSVALSAGGGKTDELASLAAQAAGVPTTCTLKVDGAAKAGVPSVGGDGDTFTVGLTLKVSKS